MVAIQVTVPSLGYEIYSLTPQGQAVPDPHPPPVVVRDAFFHGESEEETTKNGNLRGLKSEYESEEDATSKRLEKAEAVRNTLAEAQQTKQRHQELKSRNRFRRGAVAVEGGDVAAENSDGGEKERFSMRRLLASGKDHMENEFLEVTVEPAGTISVLHKASGKKYEGQNKLEDTGDSGDQYGFRGVSESFYFPPLLF